MPNVNTLQNPDKQPEPAPPPSAARLKSPNNADMAIRDCISIRRAVDDLFTHASAGEIEEARTEYARICQLVRSVEFNIADYSNLGGVS